MRRSLVSLVGSLLLSVACSSSTDGPGVEMGGSAGDSAGAPTSAGGALLAAGAGGSATAGGGALLAAGAGGSATAGAAGAPSGNPGTASSGASGATAAGGTSAGASATGGAHAGGGGASAGSACPGAGHITYVLAKSASPTPTEQAAYDKIKIAMDKAISYYDCYTSISKSLNVSYVPSVETADGNINGSIRFGMNTTYMDYRSAMHEIAHTLGIGQASNWASFLSGGRFTGQHAALQLQAINAKLATPLYPEVHADTQHFWPYGLNQQSEVKSEADLIAHCQMVVAIRQDVGL